MNQQQKKKAKKKKQWRHKRKNHLYQRTISMQKSYATYMQMIHIQRVKHNKCSDEFRTSS